MPNTGFLSADPNLSQFVQRPEFEESVGGLFCVDFNLA